MYIVGTGFVLYTLPYFCIKLVYKGRNRRGISPRCSSMSLRETFEKELYASRRQETFI